MSDSSSSNSPHHQTASETPSLIEAADSEDNDLVTISSDKDSSSLSLALDEQDIDTDLIEAAEFGNENNVARLLQQGADALARTHSNKKYNR